MKYWRTKSGEKIAIKDMETSHIENCIKMLERTKPDHQSEIDRIHEDAPSSFVASELLKLDGKFQHAIRSLKWELQLRVFNRPVPEHLVRLREDFN